MKTAELTGRRLDEWVARAEGHYVATYTSDGGPDILAVTSKTDGRTRIIDGGTAFEWLRSGCYHPSLDWKDGGAIIGRERINLNALHASTKWSAQKFMDPIGVVPVYGYGLTALEAAMRCFVMSKFGEEVGTPTHQG